MKGGGGGRRRTERGLYDQAVSQVNLETGRRKGGKSLGSDLDSL
jgi:hypothetical protein